MMNPSLFSYSQNFKSGVPLCFSCNPYVFPRPKLSVKIPFSERKTVFWDGNLSFLGKHESWDNFKRTRLNILPIRAVVKRRKEIPFDNVIQRDKKLKLVLKIRKILVSQPDRIMLLRDLGMYRRELGLDKKRRLIVLLKKFPAVFEIVEEGVYSLTFKMTPEAERLYLEELQIRNEMENLLVIKLRKLLMMSAEKRILLEKIAHLKTDFGLPLEFRDTICHRYLQYFRVVSTGRGPALELTHWDPELAVSAAELAEEEKKEREIEERNLIIERKPKFNQVKLPKGLSVSKGEMRRICQFRDMPYISPYADFSSIRSGTAEKEKHACGVVHELLSLTIEKRILVDHLTHFREEFRFSQQVRGMLIRHPDMFYVSLKGDRDSVFLREAYRDSQLIEKDKLSLIKEKFRLLVEVPRFRKRSMPRGTDETDVDVDDDDYDDDDDDEEDDDWSDEEDDMPPDFEDEDGTINIESIDSKKKLGEELENDKKVLVPVFPDGQPRQRW